jgi:hypothetical protein
MGRSKREMNMVGANRARVETAPSANVLADAVFMRGLAYGMLFSVPLWGALIALARLAF